MSFTAQLRSASRNIDQTLNKARILLIQRLFRDITFDTPVLDGFLRGSWKVSEGEPSDGVGGPDLSGQVTVNQMNTSIGATQFKSTVYLVNNQPYAYRIEFEGWSSIKAPDGMVRRNFLRVQKILKQVQLEVNRGGQ